MIKEAIAQVVDGRHLSESQAQAVMGEIMRGESTPAQTAAFLAAMRMKGETVGEIAALARGMREHAKAIRPKVTGRIVDTCGTGGDGLGTFNISTASMFVASGAGVPVAKHGNRSVSSRCGSADVLEHLGARLDLTPPEVEEVMERAGICFMFAPVFHPAMKHALGPRREMGIRTVFNILGPLTNPCDAKGHVLGVYDASLTEKIAHVAAELGLERAFVVHGLDGQDEISTTGPTLISELADGTVSSYELTPDSLGIEPTVLDELKGGSVEVNARIMLDVLSGRELGARRDAVVANGAAAIASSRESGGIADAMDDARGSIDTGKALQRLIRFVQATGGSTDVITELLEAPM